jgi:hypothetical protein
MGRPPKGPSEKYHDVHIRLHPQALAWARAEAKKRGIGYQTVINEVLLHRASRSATGANLPTKDAAQIFATRRGRGTSAAV